MDIIKLYKALLKVGNLNTSEDGFISSVNISGEEKPVMIDGKRLVLPIVNHLSNPKPESQIIFHPLSENMLRNESIVLDRYRAIINIRLRYVISTVTHSLLTIATSVAEHSKLTPDQLEFLSVVKNADAKTLDVFEKILEKMPANQIKASFVNIYIKRGGLHNGVKFSRVGIVNFPFYEELKECENEIYGVKLRVKDKETFIKLFEYIFPNISVAGSYNRPSNSTIAPNLDALMKTIITVAGPINDQITLFSNLIDGAENLAFNSEWVDTFDNLEVMVPQIRLIPMQAGNEGSADNVRKDAIVATPPPQVVLSQVVNPQVQQVQQVPYQAQPMQQVPYMQPNMFQPQPPQLLKNSNGRLDFESVMRAIPGVGGIQQQPPYQGMQMERQPTWSQQQFPQPQQFGNNQFGNQQLPQGNNQFPQGRI